MWCGLGGEMNIRGKCGRFYPNLQGIPVRQEVVDSVVHYPNIYILKQLWGSVKKISA